MIRILSRPESRTLTLFLPLLASLLITGCTQEKPSPAFSVSAGSVTGTIEVARQDLKQAEIALMNVRDKMRQIVRELDPMAKDSDVARINTIAATSRWPLSRDVYRILDLANHYAELTGGAYDMTIASIYPLWTEAAALGTPEKEVMETALQNVGPDKLRIFDDNTLAITSPRTKIDPMGLADAYMADTSIVELRNLDITNVLVRIDQAARALGQPSAGQPWQVILQDPRKPGQPLGRLRLSEFPAAAWAEPGKTTAQQQIAGGMLDPRNGYPADGAISAVVLGKIATKSRALALALVVTGLKDTEKLMKNFPDCEFLVMTKDNPPEIWMTEEFKANFALDPAHNATIHLLKRTAVSEAVTGDQ